MHATVGCKLLSGCLKCCVASSAKWIHFLTIAMLATSSWSDVFSSFQVMQLWRFFRPHLFWLGAHDLRRRNAASGRSRWGDRGVEFGLPGLPSWTGFGAAGWCWAQHGATLPKLLSLCYPQLPVSNPLPFATLCYAMPHYTLHLLMIHKYMSSAGSLCDQCKQLDKSRYSMVGPAYNWGTPWPPKLAIGFFSVLASDPGQFSTLANVKAMGCYKLRRKKMDKVDQRKSPHPKTLKKSVVECRNVT